MTTTLVLLALAAVALLLLVWAVGRGDRTDDTERWRAVRSLTSTWAADAPPVEAAHAGEEPGEGAEPAPGPQGGAGAHPHPGGPTAGQPHVAVIRPATTPHGDVG